MRKPQAPPEAIRADPESNVRRSFDVIRRLDDGLRACILVRAEAAAEARHLAGTPSPGALHGWTIGVKDNIDVAGTVRTDGLPPPHPPPATHDSQVVARLRAAGAVVVAKTNLEELSFAATTQNAWWGRCRNPWDPARLPGGSSGGSAVAVAAGMVDAALGTDTGGSVRNPAAFCGISALRPTVGWVSTAGVTPLCPEFDVVGPMARRVTELRTLLAVLTGRRMPKPATPDTIRIGIPDTYFFDNLDAGVAAGCAALIDVLAGLGASIASVPLRGARHAADASNVLLNVRAAATHAARLTDERVHEQVRDRLALGQRTPEKTHAAAQAVASRWARDVAAAFEHVDMLLVPTTPAPAPPIDGTHRVAMSRGINRFATVWSPARLPVLALPCGHDAAGLPVGAQLVGPPGSDWRLLDAGAAVQATTGWHERQPSTPDFSGRPR